MLWMAPEAVVWHRQPSHTTAVRGQHRCATSHRAGGASTVNSSETPFCCITSRRISHHQAVPTVGTAPSGPQTEVWPQLCWSAWVLPVILEVVVSVSECVWSTKIAIHSQVLWTQIYCENSEFQSLWGTWHLNKQNTSALIIQLAAFIFILLAVQGREGKLALTWSSKCSQTPNWSRCSQRMKHLKFSGRLLVRSRDLSPFEQQICNYLLELLPGDCSCCWPLWNIQKLACCTMVIRKY